MSSYTVVLFPTNAHVMRAEKLIQVEGVSCKLIPVPRHLSSDCGVCLRIDTESIETIRSLLINNKLAYDDMVDQI